MVGVRDDHRLHVCDLSTSTAEKVTMATSLMCNSLNAV